MKLNKINTILLTTALSLAPSFAFAGEMEDTALAAAVKAALMQEKDMPVEDIKIEAHDKVVTLRGKLPTELQADRAVEISSSVEGVDDVKEELRTANNKVRVKAADSLITLKAKGKIAYLGMQGKIAKGYELHIETVNKGEVHVKGKVTAAADEETVKAALGAVKGVTSVKSNITIEGK